MGRYKKGTDRFGIPIKIETGVYYFFGHNGKVTYDEDSMHKEYKAKIADLPPYNRVSRTKEFKSGKIRKSRR